MDTVSIVDYIKKNYPKVVFNPVKFAYKKAVGFIVSNGKMIIGFINSSGNLCKLVEPIDMSNVTKDDISNAINKIPIVEGFGEKDKERILKLFNDSTDSKTSTSSINVLLEEKDNIIRQLRNELQEQESKYKILYDTESNKHIAIKKEYEEKIKDIQDQFAEKIKDIEGAKESIITSKDNIIQDLQKYKTDVEEYIKSKDLKIEELQEIYKKLENEKNEAVAKLEGLLKSEEERNAILQNNKELLSDYTQKLETKEKEIDVLNVNVKELMEEIQKVRDNFNQSEMQKVYLEGYKARCNKKIMEEKDQLIEKINDYNSRWNDWMIKTSSNFEEYKRRLISELQQVDKNLKDLFTSTKQQNELSVNEQIKLRQNIKDLQNELQRTVTEQLIKLNEKDEQIRILENAGVGLVVPTDPDTCSSELKEKEESLKESEEKLENLRKELESVKQLLAQNKTATISNNIDYDNCYSIISNFLTLNNVFYRKQEIVERLEKVLKDGLSTNFENLHESVKEKIKSRFEDVKTKIMNHIKFLDLEKYIKSPDFVYLKSKATRNKVSPNFCTELSNILEYWNEHKGEYREQDRILTNIYEDLSGAVRVYIRIKPLIGSEQSNKVVLLQTESGHRNVTIDCVKVPNVINNVKETFGEFYGIFNENYTNLDVYTGLENSESLGLISQNNPLIVNVDDIVTTAESISPGLYSSFKQVEDGYSIVVFGYGPSGSGKTHSLLGSKGVPGLLHYGLANMKGVKNIKLKYLFEQYVQSVDVNFGKVRGKIYNLIREVPQMREYSVNETGEFAERIQSNARGIDINNLAVEDLYVITSIIEEYRIEKKRIKMTPNNPVSSRSHLFMVFEVTFEGKVGYVTIVDTAGRESPIDILNTFVDMKSVKLASIMAPPPIGGPGTIAKYKNPSVSKKYTPEGIFDILKEGFYINETLNHLIYYFKMKNFRKFLPKLQSSDPDKYDVSKFYVKPNLEENAINKANNCLMIPIMNFLDNLSNKKKSEEDYNPTKFIMTCMIRQEEKYCDQIYETIKFADNVAST